MNGKKLISSLAVGLLVMTASFAQNFPSYYPKEGFQRVGTVDALYAEENRVVIDDVEYLIADELVVHALNAYSVSSARLRPGIKVGFKQRGNRVISEFWLLPINYDARRRPQ